MKIKHLYIICNSFFNFIFTRYVFTYKIRPALAFKPKRSVSGPINTDHVSIIIQGSAKLFDFLYQTCELYRGFFEGSPIVVSTWCGELNSLQKHNLEKIGVDVLENEHPQNKGHKNFNLQLISTKKAIDFIKIRYGSEYILKTRADQRIYNQKAIGYFLNLYDTFSVHEKKIIVCSLNTFRNRIFAVSDMLIFSDMDSMDKYWSAPLDLRVPELIEEKISQAKTHYDFSRINVCEQYLVTNYLTTLKIPIIWTEDQYIKVLAKYFVVVDRAAVDLLWTKYSYAEELWTNYDDGGALSELGFNDWLILHSTVNEN